jgi:hypothetical protein
VSTPRPGQSPRFSAEELRHWSLLEEFARELEKAAGPRSSSRRGGPRRLLGEEHYFCAFLFALFNPVIDSMRGLCAASGLERVQREVCGRPISLGSFSEAQSVFGFARLERVFEQLARAQVQAPENQAHGVPRALRAARRVVDSSLFRALPRMQWAVWRHQHQTQRAVRLHLQFHLLEERPVRAQVSAGRTCEREAFEQMICAGDFYVGDRNYGRDYRLLSRLQAQGCGYVMRLCEQANCTVLAELPLSEEDRRAGVVRDQLVRLGARERWHCGPVRVVRVEKERMEEPLLLVSNQLEGASMDAALLAEIYRQRWLVELFFRWFKCILGRPGQWHWLAESPQGAAIQIYLSLIAALLLSRHLGRLPGKREMERLRFYLLGMASHEELASFLERAARQKRT